MANKTAAALSALFISAVMLLATVSPADAQSCEVVATCPASRSTPYPVGTKPMLACDTSGNLCQGAASSGGAVTQGTTPWTINGYDSGTVVASQTPANDSHTAGQAMGSLFSVALARAAGGSGIITNFGLRSAGGLTVQMVVRIWQKNPANTTCTDSADFAGSATDDAFLVVPPFSVTPAAPAVVTGDAATYAAASGVTWDYKNADTSPGQNVYVCLQTVTSVTPTASAIQVTLSGPQN